MSEINVLDASAALAYLLQEKGMDTVDAEMDARGSVMSAVNLAEIVGKLLDYGMPPDTAVVATQRLRADVRDFDSDLAIRTGIMREANRSIGASLGDRACLALAAAFHEAGDKVHVLTAEKGWKRVRWPFDVILIR